MTPEEQVSLASLSSDEITTASTSAPGGCARASGRDAGAGGESSNTPPPN